MKIAMNLRTDADRLHGGDTVVMRKLSAALQGLGVEVAVGALSELPPAQDFDLLHLFGIAPIDYTEKMLAWARAGGVPVILTPLYHAMYHQWFHEATAAAGPWRLIERVMGQPAAWAIYQAFQNAKMPLVASWRRMRHLLLAADCVAASTHWENAYLAEHFRLPPQVVRRMRLVAFGVDAALYGRTFTAGEIAAFRACYDLETGYVAEVARVEPKKNQLAVIEALADLDMPLVFVGQPSLWPDYVAQCHAAGARRGRVRFIEWLPEAELPLLYAGAAAHIQPSWVELPGLATLEAAACGCKVIAAAVPGKMYRNPPDCACVAGSSNPAACATGPFSGQVSMPGAATRPMKMYRKPPACACVAGSGNPADCAPGPFSGHAVAAVNELLNHQVWVCDPFDPASIRAAVIAALAAPPPVGLRERVLAELNWERAAEANLALYREVVR